MSATVTNPAAEGQGLAELEPPLSDMGALAGILAHIATADTDPNTAELAYLAERLREVHRKMADLWQAAWEERKAEHEAHRAALAEAEARAREAAPGSVAQMQRAAAMLLMLRSGARVLADRVAEMEGQVAAAVAEREGVA